MNEEFKYVYNLNGRIPISNKLTYFLYDKIEHNSSVNEGLVEYDRNNYCLQDLLNDIRIRYNSEYRFFPYLTMTIEKANELLQKRMIPFRISIVDNNDNIISKSYKLEYIGDFVIDTTLRYSMIYSLDSIFCLLNDSCKFSHIFEKNMKMLSDLIKEFVQRSYYLKASTYSMDFNNIIDLNKMIKDFNLPFIFKIINDYNRILYVVEKTD